MTKERLKPPSLQAGAWAIIHCIETDKFLLGKRSASVNNGGAWNFFGGRLDHGEEPCRALMRELAEEAGLRIKQKQLIKLSHLAAARSRGTHSREMHYYLLTVDREVVPRLNDEHSRFRWFERHSLPARFNRPTTVAIKHGLLKKVKA